MEKYTTGRISFTESHRNLTHPTRRLHPQFPTVRILPIEYTSSKVQSAFINLSELSTVRLHPSSPLSRNYLLNILIPNYRRYSSTSQNCLKVLYNTVHWTWEATVRLMMIYEILCPTLRLYAALNDPVSSTAELYKSKVGHAITQCG